MSRFGFTFLYPLHNPLLFSIWTFVLFYNAGMFSDISLSCLSLLCLFSPCGVNDRNVLGRHGLSSSRLVSSLLSAALCIFSSNLFFNTWLCLKSWLCLICCLTCPLSCNFLWPFCSLMEAQCVFSFTVFCSYVSNFFLYVSNHSTHL